MEIISLVINGLKTIVGAIYPPLKKKFFDQPKIYIRLTGTGSTFRSEFANINSYQHQENMLNRLQIVDATWQRKLTFFNNSEHVAYDLRMITLLDKKNFSIEPDIDNLKPLSKDSDITYSLKFSDTFERRERETQSDYPAPTQITNLKLILEYTNMKGTKFYTIFDNFLDEQNKNKFVKRINRYSLC